MKILITGCAGFIGTELAVTLLNMGHTVVGVDNMNEYYDVSLKDFRESYIESCDTGNRFEFEIVDIASPLLDFVFEHHKPDVVVNLAAQAGVRYSMRDPMSYVHSNLNGFANVLELSRKYGCKFLYASSSSVYGNNYGGSESDVLGKPLNIYAATKMCNELLADSYYNSFGYPSIGLRFFSVYGPLGRPDMLPMIVADAIRLKKPITIYGDGNCERDFTYIDDIVVGIVQLIDKCDEHGVFNIGRGEPVTVNRVIELIEEYMGDTVEKIYTEASDMEAKKTLSNTGKILKFGYKPNVSIEFGLKEFCDWYLDYYHMRPDCDSCGDYEYCAFHYDECTGYIPGNIPNTCME